MKDTPFQKEEIHKPDNENLSKGCINSEEDIEAWLKLVHEGPCCGHPVDNQFTKDLKKQD